jgi:hypothetical protein
MSALQNEIGKLKTLKESFSNLADSVANQKETNENILTLLSQFGESVLQEKVTVILNCQENIVWQNYAVSVTFEDGRVQAVPLSENGTCSFSIKIGQNYSVQLPVIGTFIAPELKTYTAISSAREIYWSYVAMGMFGMDELGRRYSIAQIEALADKSVIKYGGIATTTLENSLKEDGSSGNSYMWKIGEEFTPTKMKNLTAQVEAELELIPTIEGDNFTNNINLYYDGETYTDYLISEAQRLFVDTPMSRYCREQTITINGKVLRGFVPSPIQYKEIINNIEIFKELYIALGRETIDFQTAPYNVLMTSCLYKNSSGIIKAFTRVSNTSVPFNNYTGAEATYCFVIYPLYK